MYKAASKHLQHAAYRTGTPEDAALRALERRATLRSSVLRLRSHGSSVEAILVWAKTERVFFAKQLLYTADRASKRATQLSGIADFVERHDVSSKDVGDLGREVDTCIKAYKNLLNDMRSAMIDDGVWAALPEDLKHIRFRYDAWQGMMRRSSRNRRS